VYVYYQLENFYQNHRRYVKSRDYQQLMGEYKTVEEIQTNCNPIVTNEDLGRTYAADGVTKLVSTDPANPCGLVAKSLFNDTYVFYNTATNPTSLSTSARDAAKIDIDDTNIAWKSDTENKFKNCDSYEVDGVT